MKTRLKHLSKSTISVLLALLMVVSTVTVGIITTTAAFYDDDQVGFNFSSQYICVKIVGASDVWIQPGTSKSIDLGSVNNGDKIYFDLYADESYGGTRHYFNQNAGLSATNSSNCSYNEGGSNGNNRNYFTVGSYNKFKLSANWEGGGTSAKLTVSDASGSTGGGGGTQTGFLAGSYVYLKPNDIWDNDNAKFAAYFFNSDSDNAWSDFVPNVSSGNTTAAMQVPGSGDKTWEHVVFVRFNPADTTPGWNGNGHVWNKTVNLDFDNRYNRYTIAEGQGSEGTGTWSGYAPTIGTGVEGTLSPASSSITAGNSVTYTSNVTSGNSGEYIDKHDTLTCTGATSINDMTVQFDEPGNYTVTDTITYKVFGFSGITTTAFTPTATVTVTAATFDTYYLAGRITVKENNGAGPNDTYPDTSETGYKYNSTKIPFTQVNTDENGNPVDAGYYQYNTGKTVKQLAELKGSSNRAQNFRIYDRAHLWGDDSSSKDFYDCLGSVNAITTTARALSSNQNADYDLNFNHDAHQYDDSDGQVIIWLDARNVTQPAGTGTMKIFYTIVNETTGIADSVSLSASPEVQKWDKNMKLTASLQNAHVPADTTCTYAFYDGDTLLDTVSSTTGVATYTVTAPGSEGGGVHHYNVRVSTTATYDGSSTPYRGITARKDGTFIKPEIWVSCDLTNDVTPGYTASNWTQATDNATSWQIAAATNQSTFTFALSGEQGYDTTFSEYTIDDTRTKYVNISMTHADVTVNGETVTVRTYTCVTRTNCSGMQVYLDTQNGKVYATATYNGVGTRTNTFDEKDKNGNTKTYRYYFAEVKEIDDGTKDNKGSDIFDDVLNGIYVYYWNASASGTGTTGRVAGTPVNQNGQAVGNTSGQNIIYIDQSALIAHNGNSYETFTGGSKNMQFQMYYCDIPVWATAFKFAKSTGTGFTSAWEVLNPNRVYCLFEWNKKAKVSAAVLDESLWSQNTTSGVTTSQNQAPLSWFDTNLIKYTRNDTSNANDAGPANTALSTQYNTSGTQYPLYFGNYAAWDQSVYNPGQPGTTYHAFDLRFNLAQRGGDAKDKKTSGGCAYYASIWNLTGFLLDKAHTNDIGGYYLTNPNNDNHMPLFDYDTLSSAATVYQAKKFPFYKSSYNGVTTYSYDSLSDPNRLFSNNAYTVEDTVGVLRHPNDFPGYQPFADQEVSIANEFDVNFFMTSTGTMITNSGDEQDIAFNFSGDDDVWVYVDGVKVLDLGGDHMISSGSINFSEMKVYYKTAAENAPVVAADNTLGYNTNWKENNQEKGYEGLGGAWAYSKNNVYTVNLQHLFESAGINFKNTDATTKHKLQMFYVERGQNESNLSLEFNLPQASGLSVKNNVTTDNVNPGLVDAAKGAASGDYFVYSVENRLSTATDVSNTRAHSGVWNNVRAQASSVSSSDLKFGLPKYPTNAEAIRDVSGIQYYLAKSLGAGSSASGYTPPTSTSTFVPITNTNYYLSDENLTAKAENLSGQVRNNGELYLLSGQMANFRDTIGANTSVAVKQKVILGEAEPDSDDIVHYQAVAKNDTGNYYITSYSITEDNTNTVLQSRTGAKFLSGTNDSLLALDKNTSNNDSFYFSSYSADSDKDGPAMTVEFYNDIAVGDIKVEKKYDKTYADMSTKFRFTVQFANIFGDDENYATLQEYNGLVYYVYNADGSLAIDGPQIYSSASGLILKAGQYALIKGVPVETRFKITERDAANHSLVSIQKTATKKASGNTLNNVSELAIDSSTFYNETINSSSTDTTGTAPYDSWNGATSFANKSTSDGYKNAESTDDIIYYVNMIPNVAESKTNNDIETYQSLSAVVFTNEKQKFSVVFKYYDRANENDTPSHINSLPTSYTVNFDGLTEYTEKFTEVTTIYNKTYQVDDFKKYNFTKLIQDAAIEFASDTNISNLLDDYHMWTTQTAAVTALTDHESGNRNVKADAYYSENDVLYHTNYIGEPQTAAEASNERWVTYKDSKGNVLSDPYGFTKSGQGEPGYLDGDMASWDAVNSIVVWCYNQPKQYNVTVHKTTATDTMSQTTVTLNGKSKNFYKSDNSNTEVFNAYYNQRLGYNKEGYNDGGFYDQYNIPGYNGAMPENQIAETINGNGTPTYQFAYWAFDENGTQVASTELHYFYRVTKSINLYPIYTTIENPVDVGYGLTAIEDQADRYVDGNGTSKTRLNVMFNPYGLSDYDPNVKDSVIMNIIFTDESLTSLNDKGLNDDDAIIGLFNEHKADLQSYLNTKAKAKMTDSIGNSFADYVNRSFMYTIKGNADDNGSIANVVVELTNKNRMQFTSIFNTSALYRDGKEQKVLQVTAMKYNVNGTDTWVISDNCIINRFYKAAG